MWNPKREQEENPFLGSKDSRSYIPHCVLPAIYSYLQEECITSS